MRGGSASGRTHPKLFIIKAKVTCRKHGSGDFGAGMVSVGLSWETKTVHGASTLVESLSLSARMASGGIVPELWRLLWRCRKRIVYGGSQLKHLWKELRYVNIILIKKY